MTPNEECRLTGKVAIVTGGGSHGDGVGNGRTHRRDDRGRGRQRGCRVLRRDCIFGGAVRFPLSDQARYITGQTLVVDGGATLVGPSRAH